eukprot:Hpha_TRINITY_DN11535_c0_g1::TRINITY_DN11535_c0_g1_i1::g.32188::m.32188
MVSAPIDTRRLHTLSPPPTRKYRVGEHRGARSNSIKPMLKCPQQQHYARNLCFWNGALQRPLRQGGYKGLHWEPICQLLYTSCLTRCLPACMSRGLGGTEVGTQRVEGRRAQCGRSWLVTLPDRGTQLPQHLRPVRRSSELEHLFEGGLELVSVDAACVAEGGEEHFTWDVLGTLLTVHSQSSFELSFARHQPQLPRQVDPRLPRDCPPGGRVRTPEAGDCSPETRSTAITPRGGWGEVKHRVCSPHYRLFNVVNAGHSIVTHSHQPPSGEVLQPRPPRSGTINGCYDNKLQRASPHHPQHFVCLFLDHHSVFRPNHSIEVVTQPRYRRHIPPRRSHLWIPKEPSQRPCQAYSL